MAQFRDEAMRFLSSEAGPTAHDVEVETLIAHARQRLAAGLGPTERGPLWTGLDTDWAHIRFLLRQAERDGQLDDQVIRHVPDYPMLALLARRLGLRRLAWFAKAPCQLGLRLFRPMIRRAACRQERVNLSLVHGTRGVAARLMELEERLPSLLERLAELERQRADDGRTACDTQPGDGFGGRLRAA